MQFLNYKDIFQNKVKSKNVLITGSSGYVGGQLVEIFKDLNCNLIGIDKEPLNSSIEEFSLNLVDSINTKKILDSFKPDLIFHAGTNSAQHYKSDLLKSFNEDYHSISNIFNYISSRDTKFVYYSSSYVYSGVKGKVSEDNVNNPVHNFGLGKRFFEQLILRKINNPLIFRLSSVIGNGYARQPNAIKELISEIERTNRLTIWGDGNRKMQYIPINDVLSASLLAYEAKDKLYNLGADDYLSLSQVASIFEKISNCEVKYDHNKAEGETLPFMINNKLKHELNFDFTNVIEFINNYYSNTKRE